MSLTPQTLRRLPKIKQGILLNHNRQTIGKSCGVTEKTIDRDMKAWVESGDFETWLKTEFVALHNHVVIANPTIAYKEMARLMGKMVTRKAELKTVEEIREIKLVWNVNNPKHKLSTSSEPVTISQQ